MIQELIPVDLENEIANHLRTSCAKSIRSTWRHNKSDEDSITAAFLQSMSKEKEVMFAQGHYWEWDVEYSTTSSRGPKPLESVIGADAIFFIEIKLPKEKIYRKGLMIQSKIKEKMIRKELENQVRDMENYVPNCSIVLGYEESQFRSVKGLDYLSKKNKHWKSYSVSFCDFLADSFLTCKYGIENLYYDFSKNEVHFDDLANNRILFVPERGATKIEIRQL